ncbi:MAG: ATP-binding protein [Lachnospiraceae bacterium]|nr:ATP-binding protein [Lachnospiraceae bacterium]
MSKIFNTAANCIPQKHYMVDLTGRLEQIKVMVDRGDYFTINRARQYGKTTTLMALAEYLKKDYLVVSLDFQELDESDWQSVADFVSAFAEEVLAALQATGQIPDEPLSRIREFAVGTARKMNLKSLFLAIGECCVRSPKPIVLMIDEADAAAEYEVFLDFLAQLRARYIKREQNPTFHSVILAGVHDIKSLKRKFVEPGEHSTNSPWIARDGNEENASLLAFDDCPRDQMELAPFDITSDYLIDMSFSADDIAGMLREYEKDYETGMDVQTIAQTIYDYTSGYPFLVSRICKILDERIQGTESFPDRTAAWTKDGVIQAVGIILAEKNTLFDSLIDKVNRYPDLRECLYAILMKGSDMSYSPDIETIDVAQMYGFVKIVNSKVVIANRIFETRLYNFFLLSEEGKNTDIYQLGLREKYQFIREDGLNMKLILERFVAGFDDLYGDQPQKFKEDDGRRYFLLFLRPIINGEGNYYIESRTRNMERTDIIIDFKAKQYVIELKLWHGNAYNERGEQQLIDYLEYYHLKKGYMLSFNFNKKKQPGVNEIHLGDKLLVEAVV